MKIIPINLELSEHLQYIITLQEELNNKMWTEVMWINSKI